MFTVTLHAADATELRRLADSLESFCTVQARAVRAADDPAANPAPIAQPETKEQEPWFGPDATADAAATAPEPEPYEDKATVKKRRGRKKAAAPDAADAPAPAPAKSSGVSAAAAPVSDDDLIKAVRGAMRGDGGIPAVRALLDEYGVRVAPDTPAEKRPALLVALHALADGPKEEVEDDDIPF